MWAVVMDEYACRVDAVVGISPEMITSVHDHAFPTRSRETLGNHQPREACANDEEIGG